MTYSYDRRFGRHKKASGIDLLDPEIQSIKECIKEREQFIRRLDKALSPLRNLAEILESKSLGKMCLFFDLARSQAEKDIQDLFKIRKGLEEENRELDRMYEKGQEPGDNDASRYRNLYEESDKIAARLWELWMEGYYPSMDEFFYRDELRSRVVNEVEEALERLDPPEEFGPIVEDWQDPDDVIEELRSQILDLLEE